ncbi:NAD(P)-binding protein [Xylariaceae sp. FL1019]|nr:NAD(P)-binding protein [Xylariaceae sp. FL1019]
MPSYLITGVSRGIGYEFLRQLSADPDNVAVGLVRDKASTDKKVLAELDRPNIHIVEADLADRGSLEKSVESVSAIVNGSLDYIIANAALVPQWGGYDSIGDLAEQDADHLERELLDCFKVNAVGNINLFNLYLPLILRGKAKKCIAISSGLADLEMTTNYKVFHGAPYAISKSALNMAVAKFHAQYADQGVCFMSICPGLVDSGGLESRTEYQMGQMQIVGAKFMEYQPTFDGKPSTMEEAVRDILKLIGKASLEEGYGGRFMSHLGKDEKYL